GAAENLIAQELQCLGHDGAILGKRREHGELAVRVVANEDKLIAMPMSVEAGLRRPLSIYEAGEHIGGTKPADTPGAGEQPVDRRDEEGEQFFSEKAAHYSGSSNLRIWHQASHPTRGEWPIRYSHPGSRPRLSPRLSRLFPSSSP